MLFVCCIGLLDLYHPHLGTLERNLRILAGGVIGRNLNTFIFGYFGTVGATILFLMLLFISVLLLTNFQLGTWVRASWRNRASEQEPTKDVDEKALERRATDLKKQARKLQEEVERSGLGADMQPVPKPTVRDSSIPQPKSGRNKASESIKEPEPAEEGEVIPAHEVAAATSAEILGKNEAHLAARSHLILRTALAPRRTVRKSHLKPNRSPRLTSRDFQRRLRGPNSFPENQNRSPSLRRP